ncbi:hypothetical protein M426DRAFT_322444 [Hypoxylon sp. CI-4A]|nr:hypothetical protein M426DRAFT_322444 [Hypoxylon sp. CI-4A]
MRRGNGTLQLQQLVVAWFFQITSAVVLAVFCCLLLAAAADLERHHSYFGYSSDRLINYGRIEGSVILALSLATIIVDLAEIVLFAKRRLNPILLLSLACIKTTVWLAYFIVCVVSAANKAINPPNLVLSVMLAATSIRQLIYSTIVTHRFLEGSSPNQASVEEGGVKGGCGS